MKTIQTVAAALGLAAVASAHMEMTFPAPFKGKGNPHAAGDVDYTMTDPLKPDGSNFPCKGFHSLVGTDAGKPTADFTAGQSYQFTISGGAAHEGGSCQASLSFDKGSTWTVIHSYIGNCPVIGESSYDFTVPSDTPNGEAIFAWTWFNKVGNREMYMNCAAVNIAGGGASKRQAGFSSRPAMFVANVGNGCGTAETADVEFPNPGPDVTSNSAGTAPPTGNCPAGDAPVVENPVEPEPTTEVPVVEPTAEPTVPVVEPTAPVDPVPTVEPTDVPVVPEPTEEPVVPTASTTGGVFVPVPTSTLVTVTKPDAPSTPVPQPPTPPTGGAGAMPAGSACQTEGIWNCIDGTSFQRCASGQWSVAQAMASGTTCTPGQSATLAYAKRSRAFRMY